MKVIVAGSRIIYDYNIVEKAILLSTFDITELISGEAKGVDKLGIQYALKHNIPIKRFPANWNKYGKKAGYLRNIEMANYSDALIAIWDGKSKGTKHMIDIAIKKCLKVYVHKHVNRR